MILEYGPALVALAGSSLAAYVDLRTTEIPDEIPLAMAVAGLLFAVVLSLTGGSFAPLVMSILVGGLLFAFGFFMYYTGQWGGGDAKLISGVGFLLPTMPQVFTATLLMPFPLSFLINVFVLGAIYIVVYAFAISLPNHAVTHAFVRDIRGGWKEITLFTGAVAALVFVSTYAIAAPIALPLTLPMTVLGLALFITWKFLKVVERVGFYKTISVKELREGDMIGEDIPKLGLDKKLLRGLTAEEVVKIRHLKEVVTIREGVRFGPAFPIALAYTLLYGDAIILILGV